MAEIIRFKRFREYISFNENFINENPMLNFFLIESIKKVIDRTAELHQFFSITNETGCHLTVLKVDAVCLIYANGFDDTMISLLSDELDFKKFKRFNFAGSKSAIDRLFKLNEAVYSLNKHRIIYKCNEVAPLFSYSPGQLEMGDLHRLDELANFSVAFAKDYDGQVKKLEDMRKIVFDGIMNENFYQWSDGINIYAMAQTMYGEYDFPVIGHVYTNPNFRKKGFAASIVHRITKGLLDNGHEFCTLSTDAQNPASNGAFIKVGYKNIGEYIRVYKEK